MKGIGVPPNISSRFLHWLINLFYLVPFVVSSSKLYWCQVAQRTMWSVVIVLLPKDFYNSAA